MPRRTARSAPVLALLLAAAGAGPAAAATVTRTADGALAYAAAPGAVNNSLSVQVGPDGPASTVIYASADDDVTSAPADCTLFHGYGAVTVTCPTPVAVTADLGDGDDVAHVSLDVTLPVTILGGAGRDTLEGNAAAQTLDGGPGDDKLAASTGNDVVLGGDGADELQGGGGDDRVDGGAGDDLLRPDGFEDPGHDVVDGGPGRDRLEQDYVSRFTDTHPLLALTLAGGADDGRPGEGDDLRSIESVTLGVGGRFTGTDGPDEIVLRQVGSADQLSGLAGDDHLRGGDGADDIDGGAGADVVDGGYGDDHLVGGPGRDTVHADQAGADCGPAYCKLPYGNDTVDVRDGEVDTVDCGFGADTVLADTADVVAGDCESVTRSGGGQSVGPDKTVGPSPTPGRVKLAVIGSRRLADVLRRGLRVRVSGTTRAVLIRATLGGRTVASGHGRTTVTLRVSASGRRALRRARRPVLRVVVGTTRLSVPLTGTRR